jgi:endonuclease I
MSLKKLSSPVLLALCCLPLMAQADVFINEIHYDTPGTDANETIEVVATAGENLSQYRIVLYNGSNGTFYNDQALPAASTINCSASVTSSSINFTALPGGQIQNGAPDGMALVGPGNSVVQFLSYEGGFAASDGPAAGMTSTDIGVSEDNTGPTGQSLQLTGAGSSYADFSWLGEATSTFGGCNNGQTFAAPTDTAPSVLTSIPSEGAGDVAVTAPISVTFNEPIAIDKGGVALGCNSIPQPLTISGSGSSRTFTPDSALPFSATCALTIAAAAVTDLDGDLDEMEAPFTLNFQTGIDSAPTLASSIPDNNTLDFPANGNLGVTFSEPVTVGPSWFTIICSSSGTRGVDDTLVSGGPSAYTINPDINFVALESCTLQLTAAQILDLDGDPDALSGNDTVNFSIVDASANPPPVVLTTRPLQGTTTFPAAAELRVQFSEPVTVTAGAFNLSCQQSSGIALSHASMGTDFYINTGTALQGNDSCTFSINPAAISDAGGANPAAQSVQFSVQTASVSEYFAPVNTSDAQQLRCSLHQVVRGHTVYPYTASGRYDTWDVLELADEDPNNMNNILDAYRNESYPKAGGGNNNYNREHTWPNSLGFPDNGLAAYTDTHMLYLTNIGYNSDRGNNRYENCSGCTERVTVANNDSGGGSGVYPGNSNWFNGSQFEVWNFRKGDMARAVMYMAIRYEGGDNLPDLELTDTPGLITGTPSSAPVAYMGLLGTLLAWHQADPPSDLERNRNQMVFNFQGNRNPFIDHPEWATLALFESSNPPVCELAGSDEIFADGFEAAAAP